jgi:1,4-dihydroxy-2-naphthoate octaprenyltransferase
LPVVGTYFLNAHQLNPEIFLPAISIGLFSTGVLNLNNMRDIENDRNSGKNTVVVRMGSAKSKIYHTSLIAIGWLTALLFVALRFQSVYQLVFILTLPLFINDLTKINQIREPRQLDPFLKKLSIATLLFTFLFGIGIILAI